MQLKICIHICIHKPPDRVKRSRIPSESKYSIIRQIDK